MKLNQKGFGVVEGLLTIIAITLIVGVGFYVANTNKDKDKPLNTSANKIDRPTSQSTKQEPGLKIAELGVKITLPNELRDVSYTEVEPGRIEMRSEKLGSLLKACIDNAEPPKSDTASILSVVKLRGKFNEPQVEYASLLRQFDNFYLEGNTVIAECPDSLTNQDAKDKYEIAVDQYYKELEQAFMNSEEL